MTTSRPLLSLVALALCAVAAMLLAGAFHSRDGSPPADVSDTGADAAQGEDEAASDLGPVGKIDHAMRSFSSIVESPVVTVLPDEVMGAELVRRDSVWERLPRTRENLMFKIANSSQVDAKQLLRSIQTNPQDIHIPAEVREPFMATHLELTRQIKAMMDGYAKLFMGEVRQNKMHAVAPAWDMLPVQRQGEVSEELLRYWAEKRGRTVDEERRAFLLAELPSLGYATISVDGQTRLLHNRHLRQSTTIRPLIREFSLEHAEFVVAWFQAVGALHESDASKVRATMRH